MPAHFTSSGDRTQTFCIEFESLTAKIDLTMASESWGARSDFLTENLSGNHLNVVTRCGEDLMVGAFVLTNLGGNGLMEEMKKAVIEDTIESFGENIEGLVDLLSRQQVNTYFDYCLEFGSKQVG